MVKVVQGGHNSISSSQLLIKGGCAEGRGFFLLIHMKRGRDNVHKAKPRSDLHVTYYASSQSLNT